MILWAPGKTEPQVSNANWRKKKMRVLVRDNFHCQHPGCQCKNLALLTVHHITPKRAGGSDALANLQTLCTYHHQALHGMLPRELRAMPEQTGAQL